MMGSVASRSSPSDFDAAAILVRLRFISADLIDCGSMSAP